MNTAFDQLRQNHVDLASGEVDTARKSRDYLKDQLITVANNDKYFPSFTGAYLPFGSFARKTKKRLLDDIDMLIKLDGSGLSHSSYGMYTYRLWLKDSSSPLRYLTNDNDDYLNSTKVLNKIKSSVSSISTYRNSVIKRNGVAVVLNLTSYDWNFDLVPAYGASDGQGGTAFFLIPDGKGNWIATDPRKDQDAITSANKAQNGYLIPLMRLIKYWNTRYYHCPTLPSYYLETLLINGLRYHYPALSSVKVTVPIAFDALATGLLQSCPDPKGLGPNLDASLGWDDRSKVSSKAIDMAKYARWALEYEQKDDHKEAYKWWGFIFPDFPAYG